MDSFVAAVGEMDSTILVPSKLMDMQVEDPKPEQQESGGDGEEQPPLEFRGSDLYEFYGVLQQVRNDLMWGPRTEEEEEEGRPSEPPPPSTSCRKKKGHVRSPSTASTSSTASASYSESETDALSSSSAESASSSDSGLSGLDAVTDENQIQVLAEDFRRHLSGLYTVLNKMTGAAHYLTQRYQREVAGT